MTVRLGIDVLLDDPKPVAGKRIALLSHQASVTSDLRRTVDVLQAIRGVEVIRMLGPEHGFWGVMQDMEGAETERDARARVQIHSLYVVTTSDMTEQQLANAKVCLTPKEEWLRDVDAVVVDLQDIGARYYTFVYTMKFCMEVAKKMGTEVIVLDRPNPINGVTIEGNILEPQWISFVGHHELPVRHGMTIGELARLFNASIGCNLRVVDMQGWRREMWWDDTGVSWVFPSPNMATLDTATVYPGMCLVEATNVSEGRGTTKPFELFGSPSIDPFRLTGALNALQLPGAKFRPQFFKPMFQKHAKSVCGGAQLHVTDRDSFRSYRTGLEVIKVLCDQDRDFDWRREPYEYEPSEKRPAINLLTGTSRFRDEILKSGTIAQWAESWKADEERFARTRREFLAY